MLLSEVLVALALYQYHLTIFGMTRTTGVEFDLEEIADAYQLAKNIIDPILAISEARLSLVSATRKQIADLISERRRLKEYLRTFSYLEKASPSEYTTYRKTLAVVDQVDGFMQIIGNIWQQQGEGKGQCTMGSADILEGSLHQCSGIKAWLTRFVDAGVVSTEAECLIQRCQAHERVIATHIIDRAVVAQRKGSKTLCKASLAKPASVTSSSRITGTSAVGQPPERPKRINRFWSNLLWFGSLVAAAGSVALIAIGAPVLAVCAVAGTGLAAILGAKFIDLIDCYHIKRYYKLLNEYHDCMAEVQQAKVEELKLGSQLYVVRAKLLDRD
ncbi:hypothetical protein KIPB_007197 [Kipferlia bialata]|uniref:Uncharacterized protein n=1 Tax=Kipferlia bialata TaxID=797122 RepID=A0A9K3D1E2_9EUKA|nr:hypothetical protein KIPB_007197 [Kipferlia bialata]|eukprot:g7197.t1